MTHDKKPELLAPAGNLEKLKMSVLYGADAVYLGGKSFGLRAFGGNFSREDLREAMEFAYVLLEEGLCDRQYLSPHNGDLEGLPDYLEYLQEIQADARCC